MQTMEPTADQLRIATMFEGDGGNDKDLERKIKQVTEFTGCSNDQAAVALYDCDNDIQMACLKVMDAGGDSAKEADNWTAVEKPVKKERDPSADKWASERAVDNFTGRGRGRGRGYFDGGRGGRGGRGRSFANGERREFRDYEDRGNRGSFGERGRGRGRGRGDRGGFRGRSEPFRGSGGRGAPQNESRSRNRRQHSPSGSDIGSDGGWGKEEEKITNWSNKEFTRDGWNEPDSSERFNHKQQGQEQPLPDWSDSPKVGAPVPGKVEQWQNNQTSSQSNAWDQEDSWSTEQKPVVQESQPKKQHNVEANQWAAEPAEPVSWDSAPQMQSWSQPQQPEPVQQAPPPQQNHWHSEPAQVRQPVVQPEDTQRQERLAKIFNQQAQISEQEPRKVVPAPQKAPQPKPVAQQKQSSIGPPGLHKSSVADPVLSFGRSPEDAGRRLPPPTRRTIKKGVLQMPEDRDDMPKASQFVFGNIESTDDVDYSRAQKYSEKPSPPLKQPSAPGYAPQSLHQPAQTRKPTATTQSDQPKEQNKPEPQQVADPGLSYHRYAREKERAESDLRNLLKPNPQSSTAKPAQQQSREQGGPVSSTGVVPGLSVPARTSPNNPQSTGQMGSISAPGQGRSGSIGNVRTAGLGHQPYSQHENIMYQPSMNQGYDMIQIQRPNVSRHSDDGLRSQGLGGFQAFTGSIQPQQYYAPIPQYYPMTVQRSSSAYAPMYSSAQAGNTTDSMRSMRTQQQETPPPFLSTNAYGQGFPNILIPPGASAQLGPHGQHPDNRGPR
ncbi:Oidioi.mRNA.OKI2018_I69.chr1.g3411.t2.cds [Oikopleura dioica]|uniref:Oidioi.mRNA.OKI2018_I69.chr1.g3411.t2.cds n=1 Tax=Oikopleura dioica TaxID=34765 RepID=A0ABN7SVR5_OIKDI|nr:Oidioi.mRNA.OKI2018_I69.chr1.g3411.t2.cds [Oikopleura dioica]